MTCGHCGRELVSGYTTCQGCGAYLVETKTITWKGTAMAFLWIVTIAWGFFVSIMIIAQFSSFRDDYILLGCFTLGAWLPYYLWRKIRHKYKGSLYTYHEFWTRRI